MKTVYLAGPITGCDKGEANDWRHAFGRRLEHAGIRGVSPLRCEPLIGERYLPNYADPLFGVPSAIAAKNKADVRLCDLTLAYLPRTIIARRPSYGTVGELFWADAFGKPTIVVSDCEIVRSNPVILAAAGWMLDDLDQAYEVINGLLGVYTGEH